MMAKSKSNRQTSPRPPVRGSATTFDRRGARAMEHEARPPARFSSLLNPQPHIQKPKTTVMRFAHGETKVPNLFQDLTKEKPLRTDAEGLVSSSLMTARWNRVRYGE